MNKSICLIYALLVVTSIVTSASSSAAADVAKLGVDLTPLGGEKAGHGSVPAWTGTEPPLAGWSYGKLRRDFWKYKNDKVEFSIDAGNVERYAEFLTPGQKALFKQIPGYRMDVYPSRRSCGAPDFVAENSKKNVGFASLSADGAQLKDAYLPGVPFPFPASGAEVMWNAKMSYRGVGFNLPQGATMVSPRKGSNTWIRLDNESTSYYPWAEKGSQKFSSSDDVESYTYNLTVTPAAFAGQAIVSVTHLNNANESFMYFPGQRRVRRMSSYAYDAPVIGYENQYNADEISVFMGRLDRYDWKLLGKRELYIPYNAFGGYDFKEKLESVVKDNSVAPTSRRYEIHRVWVVQATVKQGARHSAPKRTFYVDEDSWMMVAAEDYDAAGALVKVREAFPIPVYETGSCAALALVQYNVAEGRYVFDISPVGAGKDIEWLVKPEGSRFRKAFYTSENLRAISDR